MESILINISHQLVIKTFQISSKDSIQFIAIYLNLLRFRKLKHIKIINKIQMIAKVEIIFKCLDLEILRVKKNPPYFFILNGIISLLVNLLCGLISLILGKLKTDLKEDILKKLIKRKDRK